MAKKVIALNHEALSIWIFTFFFIFLFSVTQNLRAEVVTDGSVGPAQSLPGPDYLVPDDIGTTIGQNLFHSFKAFSIFQGESATFTGPDHIANVISRVTGGDVSTIDGMLRSQVGQADFFFINPAGIVFGENAQIDVPAAFHASTADELRFADGAVFSATDPDASALSIAQPEAFGFLSPQPASIELNGAQLEFVEGNTVSLSSGDINIDGTGDEEGEGAKLLCGAGEINLTAMGARSGEVTLDGEPSVKAGGRLYVESAEITTSGNGGGNITVRAGEAELIGADLSAKNTGESDAVGGVDIAVDGHMELFVSSIESDTESSGNAGDVIINAGNLEMDCSHIRSDALKSEGNAGNIYVWVDGVLGMFNLAYIASDTWAHGNAGNVIVIANDLYMQDASYIRGNAVQLSEGNAGNIFVWVNGTLGMFNGAYISSDTNALGNAGSVAINAGALKMNGANWGIIHGVANISSVADRGSQGDSGTIDVTVDGQLEMLNGAAILASTCGSGNSGDIRINAEELKMENSNILCDAWMDSEGDAGNIEVNVNGRLKLTDSANISSSTGALGNAGSVVINAGELSMDSGTIISSDTLALGNAGNVVISAGELRLNGVESRISSDAKKDSHGDAGNIEVNVDGRLELTDSANISSSTGVLGNAGSVIINAGELRMDGGCILSNTGSETGGIVGNGGAIEVTVHEMFEIMNGAKISSSSFCAGGDAGDIKINAGELKISGDAENSGLITSSTGFQGDAGNIEVNVSGMRELSDRVTISSESYGIGNAGIIIINAGELKMDDGLIRSRAKDGDGGNISINIGGILEMLNGSVILSETLENGDAGNIKINACELKASGDAENHVIISSAANFEGDAGDIEVNVGGMLELSGFAGISSETKEIGDAGLVIINAGGLRMNGGSMDPTYIGSFVFPNNDKKPEGLTGTVILTVDGLMEMLGGSIISTATQSNQDAGNIYINAGELRMEGLGLHPNLGCMIASATLSDGNAGNIDLNVNGKLKMHNQALILGFTGPGGNGNPGNIKINAAELSILNGSQININAFQTLPEDLLADMPAHSIDINTHQLNLDQNSRITAESKGNVPAGAINVRADNLFVENSSRITTSSVNADAGPITIQGDNIILRDGHITTSAGELSGDGGDIAIKGLDSGPADVLVLQGGFIQANAEAPGASGGDIFIDTRAVIAEGGVLHVGDPERMAFQAGSGLNVIQAAAPGGEHGVVDLTAPELDIAASLVDLSTGFTDPIQLATDYCQAVGGEQASSLAWVGRGGLPMEQDNPWVVPFGAGRLDRLLRFHGDKAPEKREKQDRSAD